MQVRNKTVLDDPTLVSESNANANQVCFVTSLNIQEFRICQRPFVEAQYVRQYVDGFVNIDNAGGKL